MGFFKKSKCKADIKKIESSEELLKTAEKFKEANGRKDIKKSETPEEIVKEIEKE